MQPTTSHWLAAVRLALRGSDAGGELVVSSTAERTVIELRTPDGAIATATIRQRVAPVISATQLALPMGETPAPRSAPPVASVVADELVELVAVEGWEPLAHQEALDPTTMVLWTTESTDPDAEQRWRTVADPVTAARVNGLAPGCFERRAATAPSHLLRAGDTVQTNRGPLVVAGIVRDDDAGAGVVLVDGAEYPVAWTDSAAVVDGAMHLSIGRKYMGQKGPDGWWEAVHVDAKPKPAKKSRAKKAVA